MKQHAQIKRSQKCLGKRSEKTLTNITRTFILDSKHFTCVYKNMYTFVNHDTEINAHFYVFQQSVVQMIDAIDISVFRLKMGN